ncbi:MAG: hypothetical protein V1778_00170 [bacterium]
MTAIKRLYWLQSILLLGGTVFAWVTVWKDFSRFASFEGTIFKLSECVVPNPVLTPCFYGAFAFLIAFIWSLSILRRKEAGHRLPSQKKLRWLLVASVLFAWGNFGYVVYRFYAPHGDHKGCSGVYTSSPFVTPCFTGSVIFLATLVLALILLAKERHGLSLMQNPTSPQ